tara:strand:+ start:320 stop:490 length:171 start_codon:yes stop_codon:yes gene_type:complete
MKIDELRNIIRELIKSELEEASVLGTGSSFTPGESGVGPYAVPFAFKKKRKRKRKN